jgi:outer membrane protein assembly factor BamB
MRNIFFRAAPLMLLASIEGRAGAQARRPVQNQTLDWHAPAPAAFAYWTGSLVVGDTLFALYNEQRRDPAQCVRLDTGEITARDVGVPTPIGQLRPDEIPWRVAVAGGLVIAADAAPPALTAYDPCTLQRRWTTPLSSAETIPALAAAGDRIAAAVASGAPRAGWTYQLFDARSGAPVGKGPRFDGRAPDRLIVDGDRVLTVAAAERRPGASSAATIEITALDARDGRRRWSAEAVDGEVAVGSGTVVIAGAGTLEVLDAATGAERSRWADPAASPVASVALLTGGGSVYYQFVEPSGGPGTVGAFDLATGRPLWRRSLTLPAGPSWALDDDVLYLETDDGFITALDRRDGGAAWRWSVGGRADVLVAALPSGRRRLVVLDERGEIWTLARGARPAPPAEPIVVEGRVHVSPDFDGGRDPGLVIAGRRVEIDRRGRFQTVVRTRGPWFTVASRVPWAVIGRHRGSASPLDAAAPPQPAQSLLLPVGQPRRYVLNLDAWVDYPEDCN